VQRDRCERCQRPAAHRLIQSDARVVNLCDLCIVVARMTEKVRERREFLAARAT